MLKLKDICVNYSYKKVLNGISLEFQKGKIYSLLGENGAGKSTLAHVICGDLKPTSGKIYINNEEVIFKSPKAAISKGVVCIHQRPRLSKSISILDNLKVGLSGNQYKKLKDNYLLSQLMNTWLPSYSLQTKVSSLKESHWFYVSIIRALLKTPDIIILDEPPEIPKEKLQLLSHAGITVIIITHNLNEAVEKSDNIILLQNGVVLQESAATEITPEEIKQKLYGISKEVEIPSCIKQLQIEESTVKHEFGTTGYIPSDKTFVASNPNLSILQLLTAFNPKGKQKELNERALNILKKADVHIKLNEKASCLSGGMLQRLILQRELDENPKKLIMFNPTHGLDVEATERLYGILEKLSENGTEIIFGVNK